MSTTISLLQDLPVSAPAPTVGQHASRIAKAVWNALEKVGQARARGHLLQLATSYEVANPSLAQSLRHAANDLGNA